MPKTEILEIGSYRLETDPEKTREGYASLPLYRGEDPLRRLFCHHMKFAPPEAVAFLESLGIDPKKLSHARPLTEPDERGEVLFLCTARFSARLLAGGDTTPRQSVEKAGMSLIFVGDRPSFSAGPESLFETEAELRFVIPLPFDLTFFESL